MKTQYYIFLIITVLFFSCEPERPRCNDGFKNGDETEIDCGGNCGECYTCDDNFYNNGETDTDCGGPCMPCSNEWTPIYNYEPNTTNYIYTWDFSPDGLFGLVADRTSFIKKTSDGGETWTDVTLPQSWQYMQFIYVVDELNWYVQVSGWGVFKTDDGGQSWDISSKQLQSMDFFDENHGVMYFDGSIYTTNDGGDNWVYQFDRNALNSSSIERVQQSSTEYYHIYTDHKVYTGQHNQVGTFNAQNLPQSHGQNIVFKNNVGYALLNIHPRKLVKTEDFGATWNTINDNIGDRFIYISTLGLYEDNVLILDDRNLNANEPDKWYEQRYTKGFYTKDGFDFKPVGLINENVSASDCKVISDYCYCASGIALYKLNLRTVIE